MFVNAQKQQNAGVGCREFAMQVAEKMNVVDNHLGESLLSYASNPKRECRREEVMLAEDLQCDIVSVVFPLPLLRGTQSKALYEESHPKFRLLGRSPSELEKPINKKAKGVKETLEDAFADRVISSQTKRVNVFNDMKRKKRFNHCKELFLRMPDEEVLRRVEETLIEGGQQNPKDTERTANLHSERAPRVLGPG